MSVPSVVLAAYGWQHAELTPITGGLINQTFLVRDGAARAVLQRLHPIFAPEVNLDIEAVTAHLAAAGLQTPRIIRTTDDRAWIVDDGKTWRALTFVEGESIHAVPSLAWAEAAGQLVGRMHRALATLDHTYAFARVGVHDTPAHLAKLEAHTRELYTPESRDAHELAREILAAAAALPVLPATPSRHCHGDLKISNILFLREPLQANAVVDLDTVGRSTMAFELGDAMRSWCNPRGEDAGSVTFDLAIFEAAIRGFRSVADDVVSTEERRSIVIGLETVCVELAARFCVDVFRDEYFGWDSTRFPSRRAHNLVRARGQLALAMQVRGSRPAALDVVLG
jgi:Ser/Thr protein kinase RdoA (MazF antagonist)